MLKDLRYIELLSNRSYHNLDEEGVQTDPENIIANGAHSLTYRLKRLLEKKDLRINRSKHVYDHAFLEEVDSIEWAGPIRWFRGSLQVLHGSEIFPPERELLAFHRPVKDMDYPPHLLPIVFEDMMKYGYLLPNWIPLLSRVMCLEDVSVRNSSLAAIQQYQPYARDCVFKWKT